MNNKDEFIKSFFFNDKNINYEENYQIYEDSYNNHFQLPQGNNYFYNMYHNIINYISNSIFSK